MVTPNPTLRPGARPLRPSTRTARLALAALAAALPAGAWASSARAGAVIVARQSYIHASGRGGVGGPGGGYDVSDGTTGFDRFADDVGAEPGAGAAGGLAASGAQQYSVPGVMDDGLVGAFAEGSVRAEINAPFASAEAASYFDLTFRVTGQPARYDFGAALGTVGSGTIAVELLSVGGSGGPVVGGPTGTPPEVPGGGSAVEPVWSNRLDSGEDDSRTMEQTGTLDAGTYQLRVHADTTGTADESSAYYTVNLTFDAPAAAVPLPAAAWTGAAGLLALGGGRVTRALRRRRVSRRTATVATAG